MIYILVIFVIDSEELLSATGPRPCDERSEFYRVDPEMIFLISSRGQGLGYNYFVQIIECGQRDLTNF